MTGRRWFWLIVMLCNALGLWKYFMDTEPGTIWLVLWSLGFVIGLYSLVSNSPVPFERKQK